MNRIGISKDYLMPLKRYMNMDEADKAWECASRLPWLFIDYVQWCISNFPQYHSHLIGKNSQYKKFERNIAKRKETQYKNVSEGIFSKYMKLINNN